MKAGTRTANLALVFVGARSNNLPYSKEVRLACEGQKALQSFKRFRVVAEHLWPIWTDLS